MIVRTLIAAAFTVALVQPAAAAERAPFTQAAFKAAQAQGRPVVVDVAAWWCPVCRSQHIKIKRITADHRFDRLLILRLDYDKQKADWRALGVKKQATLIGYRGHQEVGRVAFQTNEALIADLLTKTVQ